MDDTKTVAEMSGDVRAVHDTDAGDSEVLPGVVSATKDSPTKPVPVGDFQLEYRADRVTIGWRQDEAIARAVQQLRREENWRRVLIWLVTLGVLFVLMVLFLLWTRDLFPWMYAK